MDPDKNNLNQTPSTEPTLETGPAASVSYEKMFEGGNPRPNYFGNLMQDNDNIISATEPLTTPDPIPEPDPVEEALKAPIKPAAPVPGSIGSAVSVPDPNVKRSQIQIAPISSTTKAEKDKKSKADKKKNIIIRVLLIMVILGIMGGIGAMYLFGGKEGKNGGDALIGGDDIKYTTLDCKYSYNEPDLLSISNATSANKYLHAVFGNNELKSISITISASFDNNSFATTGKSELRDEYVKEFKSLGYGTDPFKSEYETIDGTTIEITHSAEVADITKDNRSIFGIVMAKDKSIDFTLKTIKEVYDGRGYSCETQNGKH